MFSYLFIYPFIFGRIGLPYVQTQNLNVKEPTFQSWEVVENLVYHVFYPLICTVPIEMINIISLHSRLQPFSSISSPDWRTSESDQMQSVSKSPFWNATIDQSMNSDRLWQGEGSSQRNLSNSKSHFCLGFSKTKPV